LRLELGSAGAGIVSHGETGAITSTANALGWEGPWGWRQVTCGCSSGEDDVCAGVWRWARSGRLRCWAWWLYCMSVNWFDFS